MHVHNITISSKKEIYSERIKCFLLLSRFLYFWLSSISNYPGNSRNSVIYVRKSIFLYQLARQPVHSQQTTCCLWWCIHVPLCTIFYLTTMMCSIDCHFGFLMRLVYLTKFLIFSMFFPTSLYLFVDCCVEMWVCFFMSFILYYDYVFVANPYLISMHRVCFWSCHPDLPNTIKQ